MEEKNRGKIDETGTAERTGTERETSGSSGTSRKETGSTGGTGNGSGSTGSTGGKTENQQGQKVPQVVAVNVPEEKPKKTTKKKPAPKKQENSFSGEMISDLIVGCSQAVAMIPDQQHWEINKQEAKQIADPLVKVIEKNESLKKVAEQSDSIALVMACAMVFGPRAYISIMAAKEKRAAKKRAVAVKEVKNNDVPETGKVERSGNQDNKRNANAGTNVSPALSELLSI